MTYYLDTSALLKRYLQEAGSDWVRRILGRSRDTIAVTTQLTVVEMCSAFNRRVREGTVTPHDYMRLLGRFRDDCRKVYHLLAFDDQIVDLACVLLEHHSLRAYDAIHLATALRVDRRLANAGERSVVFLCADDRLNRAASVEGLVVDNPNDHR